MIIAEGERIFLRHLHIADVENMCAVWGDSEAMRFGQSREKVEQMIKGCLEDYYQKWGFGLWAVVLRADVTLVGYCGLTRFDNIDGQAEIELGYRLAPKYRGHGLATEAARLVQAYAFDTLGLRRLVSIISPENTQSIRVAEKIGFRYEKSVQSPGCKMQRLYSCVPASESHRDPSVSRGEVG